MRGKLKVFPSPAHDNPGKEPLAESDWFRIETPGGDRFDIQPAEHGRGLRVRRIDGSIYVLPDCSNVVELVPRVR